MNYNEKSELAKKAHALIKDTHYDAYVCCWIDFSTITMSEEAVMVEPTSLKLFGTEPEPKWDKQEATRAAFRIARDEWKAKAISAAEIEFKEVCRRLRKAKIRFRTGKQYGWPVARLA